MGDAHFDAIKIGKSAGNYPAEVFTTDAHEDGRDCGGRFHLRKKTNLPTSVGVVALGDKRFGTTDTGHALLSALG